MYLLTDLCIYLPVSRADRAQLLDGQELQVKAMLLLLLLLLLRLLWLYHLRPEGG